jgi:hypothetical protein
MTAVKPSCETEYRRRHWPRRCDENSTEAIRQHLIAAFTVQTPLVETTGFDHESKNVRILPPISGRFVRSQAEAHISAKTYENPARGTACQKTDEFSAPVTAAIIGRLMACPQKG